MKRIKLPGVLTLSFLLIGLSLAQAKDTPGKTAAATPAAGDTAKAAKPVSYEGKVSAVDKDKQSFTVTAKKGDKTFVVNDKTKILHKGTKEAAKFEDIVVGNQISGSYLKDGEVLNAYSVHIWPAAAAKAEKGSAAPEKPSTTDKPGSTAPEPEKK